MYCVNILREAEQKFVEEEKMKRPTNMQAKQTLNSLYPVASDDDDDDDDDDIDDDDDDDDDDLRSCLSNSVTII